MNQGGVIYENPINKKYMVIIKVIKERLAKAIINIMFVYRAK